MSDPIDPFEPYEEIIRDCRQLRCRQNFLLALYYADSSGLPETWDEEAEQQLPPDLRMTPAPTTPLDGREVEMDDDLKVFLEAERTLAVRGMARTRANMVWALIEAPGDLVNWGPDSEELLPRDLQREGGADTPYPDGPPDVPEWDEETNRKLWALENRLYSESWGTEDFGTPADHALLARILAEAEQIRNAAIEKRAAGSAGSTSESASGDRARSPPGSPSPS
jgi:hypothetical protein